MTDREIRFGIAAPFSGSARELGRQMKLGIETGLQPRSTMPAASTAGCCGFTPPTTVTSRRAHRSA
jgi:hypothetical protein